MASAYVDENETIYWEDGEIVTLNGNAKYSMFFDINQNPLDNMIQGQSTVFINSVKFKVSGYIDPDATDLNYSILKLTAGVVPFDTFTVSNGPSDLEDFQELKGWPLKGCSDYSSLMRPRDDAVGQTVWQGTGSMTSYTKTYKPRKSLLLSRLQSLVFTVKNDISNGSDLRLFVSMQVQAKRGD